MKHRITLLILISLLTTAIPIRSQQGQTIAPDDVVRISTNLVQIDAVVTDKSGNQIRDLNASDFEVFQDGKPQRIVSVSYVNTEVPKPVSTQASEPKRSDKGQPLTPPARTSAANAGRILTFVVDDGNCLASHTGVLASRQALEKFVNEQMLPTDVVAIYQTRSGSSVLQQYTSDKAQLLRVARKIRWYPPAGLCSNEATGDFYDPARPTTFTKNRDSAPTNIESEADRRNRTRIENRARENQVAGLVGVLSYITRGLQRVPGRKTVFLFTDGIPLMSPDSETRGPAGSPTVMMTLANTQGVMRDLIDSANRASVVFNTIDARGVTIPGAISAQDSFTGLSGAGGNIHATASTAAAREAFVFNSQSGMAYLANETGGRFFDDMSNLDVPVRRVLNLEKGYYLIGYQPEADTFKGKKFNKIEIKVRRPELSVRARSGFIGVTDEELRPKKRTGDSELYEAIAAPLPKAGLNLQLTAFFGNTASEGSFVRTLLHLDGNQISFVDEPNGLKKGVFDVVAVTLNEKNEVVEEFNRTHTIRFPAANLADINRNGLIYSADIPVKKPGVYNFRVAVRDAASKLMGSAGQQIEVPDLKKKELHLAGLAVGQVTLQDGKPVMPAIEPSQSGFSPVASVSQPAIRHFRPGSILGYSYKIYNAALDKSSRQPKLTIQVRLYKDGEVVTDHPAQPIQLEPQTDLSRLSDYGYMRLPPEMPAGDYAFQIIIKDLNDNKTTSQWIDFEVLK